MTTTAAAARARAEATREALETHSFFLGTDGERLAQPLSFSLGVAARPGDGATGTDLLAAADRRLYREKRERRRRVLSAAAGPRRRPARRALTLAAAFLAVGTMVLLGGADAY